MLERLDPPAVIGHSKDLRDLRLVAADVERRVQPRFPSQQTSDSSRERTRAARRRDPRVAAPRRVDRCRPSPGHSTRRPREDRTSYRMPVHGRAAAAAAAATSSIATGWKPAAVIISVATSRMPWHVATADSSRRPNRYAHVNGTLLDSPSRFMIRSVKLKRSPDGPSAEIVIVYRTLSIAYGFALGIPLSHERMAAPPRRVT